MTDLAPVIEGRALNAVALPGTHDSGTYAITALSTIAPGQDLPEWVNSVHALGPAGRVAAQIIAGWSKTQPVDIAAQLQAGIRYFDLRVVRQAGEYYVCHGMYSAKVDDVISAVRAFTNQHPKEIVILDFNHLYEMPNPSAHAPLVAKLMAAFGNKLAPNTLPPTTSVGELWSKGYQVIALYADADAVSQSPGLWPQSAISSPWPNTKDLSMLHADLDRYRSNRPSDQLFVLQGVLTPDGGLIGKGLLPGHPGSNQALAAEVTPSVVRWVRSWPNSQVNIVIVDWFTADPNYVDAIVGLNLGPAPP